MKYIKTIKIYDIINFYEKLDNIILLDNNEIYLIYNQSKYKIIKEGLIFSFSKDGSIYIWGDLNNDYDNLLKLINLFGWFISNIKLYNKEEFEVYKNNIKYNNVISISIEPIRDIKIDIIPNTLYHVSNSKYDHKILKKGLIPKSLSKMANHPDRIYLTDNFRLVLSLKNTFEKQLNELHTIWKIDSNGIFGLYSDINLRDGGYYTINNISPKYIKKNIKSLIKNHC